MDEARIGVVGDGLEEQALVHVWRSKERGARLVHDHDELSITTHPNISTERMCERGAIGITHKEDAIDCTRLDQQRKRLDHPRVGAAAAEMLADELPMRPAWTELASFTVSDFRVQCS